MKNSSKRLSKILKSVGRFVDEEFGPLSEGDKVKKSGELLEGFKYTKKAKDHNIFVVLQLPEGIEAVIGPRGKLYDLNEIRF